MQKNLSVYIPTYKRNELLFKTIISTVHIPNIEVIVSDNNEDEKLSNEILNFVKSHKNVSYYKNKFNIGVDYNMIKFIDLCNTKYCLLLGDDDLILYSFNDVLEYLKMDVDFFILNNCNISTQIQKLDSIYAKKIFFEKVWDKMPFGTLIINVEKARLVKSSIQKYVGTYHAYSAITWEILFSKNSSNKVYNISSEVIKLGVVEKSWKQSTAEIHFKAIPDWFALLPNELNGTKQKALSLFKKRAYTYNFFKQLILNKLLDKSIVKRLPFKYKIKFYLANILRKKMYAR